MRLRAAAGVPLAVRAAAPGAEAGDAGRFQALTRASGRAVVTTALMTAGFVTVFVGFGLLVFPFAAASQRYLPYVTAATGGVLAIVGLLLLAGRSVSLPVPRARGVGGRGAAAMFGYGIVYALASLTCTIGPFLAIVVTSLRSDDVGRGVGPLRRLRPRHGRGRRASRPWRSRSPPAPCWDGCAGPGDGSPA